MNVLLTGHAGYIGTVVARVLIESGHDVTGLDTGFFAGCGFAAGVPRMREILKDIRDVEAADFAGIDAVIHLAALCNDPLGDLDPALTADINHRATIRLARCAREAGVRRFVYASSCSLYGAARGEDLLTEEAPMRPLTPYAASKVRSEEDLSTLADSGFSPIYLRNATAYGLSPRLRGDIVLNNLVAWAVTRRLILLKSDGTPWRPIAHVEDIANAFLAALEAPREAVFNEAFNVGRTVHNYQIRDIAEVVARTVPGCRLEYASEAGPDARSYCVDFGKIARVLPAFRPRWDAAAGAQQLYTAYRSAGLTREEFEGPRYQRISHVRELLVSQSVDRSLRWLPDVQAPTRKLVASA